MSSSVLFRSDGSSAALPGSSTARTNPLGPNTRQDVDVIVVGGGISGLTAAYELEKDGLSVLVLEAKERVGGRTLTTTIEGHTGIVACDVGGQWISHSQPNALALVKELGIEYYPQYHKGRNLMQLKDSRPASYEGNIPFCLGVLTSISLGALMAWFEYLIGQPLPDSTERDPHVFDRMSIGQVARHYSLSDNVSQAFRMMTRVVFGSEPERVSMMYFLHYAKCAGTLDRLLDAGENGGQELRLAGGAQQISTKLAQRIGEDRVVCGQPVIAIEQDDAGVKVTTLHGYSYSAKRVIMATPPQHLTHMTWEPALPGWRASALSWLPMGHLIKVVLTYHQPFWRANGFSGSAASSDGVLCCVLDCTFPNDEAYGLVGFIGGDDAVYWSARTQAERRAAVVAALVSMFGPEADSFISYIDKDWSEEPYNGGCPVAAMPPGVWTMWGGRLSDPEGRVHFAGTETATQWCGYMDGAVQAGHRAAREARNALKNNNGTSNSNSSNTPAAKAPNAAVATFSSHPSSFPSRSSSSSTSASSLCSVLLTACAAALLVRSLTSPTLN